MNAIYATMTSANQFLALPVQINVGNTGCALFEAVGSVSPPINDPLFICVDFIESSMVGDLMLPILRRITLEVQDDGKSAVIDELFNKMLWLPINRSPITEIRVYICDEQGNIPSFKSCHLSCTLVCIPER